MWSSDHMQSPISKALGAHLKVLFAIFSTWAHSPHAHPTKAMAAGFRAGCFREPASWVKSSVSTSSEHTELGGVKVLNVSLERSS